MATKEELKLILEAQQKQFNDLITALLSKTTAPIANSSDLFSKINSQIPDFRYDPENDSTFSLWYERYGQFVEKDGSILPEDMKVRLILGKLSSTDFIRYEQQVLPQKTAELSFKDTIANLKSLFADAKSVFVRRFECFQLSCAAGQDILDFGATVNAKCERADMLLSKEEIKCLIFVSGLGDAHRDLRQECLRQMEKARKASPPRDIKLETLLEECRAILSLQSSAAAIGANSGHVHAISAKPQKLGDGSSKQKNSRPKGANQGKFSFQNSNSGKNYHLDRQKCGRCGMCHATNKCLYPADVKCFKCGKIGHIKPICRSNVQSRMQSHAVASIFSVMRNAREWIWVPLKVNGHDISLAADSCSHLSIIQRPIWLSLGRPKLKRTGKLVGSFSGHKRMLLGSFKCDVEFRGVQIRLELSVANTTAPSIMGLDWILPFEQATQQPIATTLEPKQMPSIVNATDDPVDQIKFSFPQVFQPGLGHCTRTKATLHLKPQARPVFCRARPVPHGVQHQLDKELDRLLDIGVLKPIDFSRWAAPIVAVRKKNGDVRICIDFSTELNDALELNRHPLPRTEDIFHALRGSKVFSQLDLRDAYLQVELDNASKSLVGINTHRGLFQYQRLPFGIKSAPSIFQKIIDQLTAGIPGVFAYLDDIVIATPDHSKHVSALFELFSRIQEYGFKVQLDKCHFLLKDLKFLGHVVSSEIPPGGLFFNLFTKGGIIRDGGINGEGGIIF